MVSNTPVRPPLYRNASSSSSIKLKKDKPRLYIALYPRGGSTSPFNDVNCDSFHWSLIIGGQTSLRTDPGTRYHVVHSNRDKNTFTYEEQDIPSSSTAQTALIRITVAKIASPAVAESILRSLSVPSVEEDPSFNCLTWTKKAFTALVDGKSGCAKSYVYADDWSKIEKCARKYVKRKREMRRFTDAEGPWSLDCISTFNFWENRETTA